MWIMCIYEIWTILLLHDSPITPCMPRNFILFFLLSNLQKIIVSIQNFAEISLSVKNIYWSQMGHHVLFGLIWVQIVCNDHQRSSKFVRECICGSFSMLFLQTPMLLQFCFQMRPNILLSLTSNIHTVWHTLIISHILLL